MNPGDSVKINATVLRVEGSRLNAQTADGRLIQTDISNVMKEDEAFIGVDFARPADATKYVKPTAMGKPKAADKKSDSRHEHKAELHAPENKSAKK